jgi:thioester reductase-like protein
MSSILLTGSSGFLGQRLLSILLHEGQKIFPCGISKIILPISNNKNFDANTRMNNIINQNKLMFNNRHNIDLKIVSMNSSSDITSSLQKTLSDDEKSNIQAVIHVGASTNWNKGFDEMYKQNVVPSKDLLQWTQQNVSSDTPFIFCSSTYVCPLEYTTLKEEKISLPYKNHNFFSNYGKSKVATEQILEETSLGNLAIVRSCGIGGSVGEPENDIPQGWSIDLKSYNILHSTYGKDNTICKELLRTPVNSSYKSHVLPVDVIADSLLLVTSYMIKHKKENIPTLYVNLAPDKEREITYGEMMRWINPELNSEKYFFANMNEVKVYLKKIEDYGNTNKLLQMLHKVVSTCTKCGVTKDFNFENGKIKMIRNDILKSKTVPYSFHRSVFPKELSNKKYIQNCSGYVNKLMKKIKREKEKFKGSECIGRECMVDYSFIY